MANLTETERLIKTYLNNKNNEIGIKAHWELSGKLREGSIKSTEIRYFAQKFNQELGGDRESEQFLQESFNRLAKPSLKPSPLRKEGIPNNSPADLAKRVFLTKPIEQYILREMIRDERNWEKTEDGVKFTVPSQFGIKSLDFDEQEKMYRIIMGATTNELGATILAMRYGEFSVTLGDTGGDLDVGMAQQNLENRVNLFLQTLNTHTPLPPAPSGPEASAGKAPTQEPEPTHKAKTPFSIEFKPKKE